MHYHLLCAGPLLDLRRAICRRTGLEALRPLPSDVSPRAPLPSKSNDTPTLSQVKVGKRQGTLNELQQHRA